MWILSLTNGILYQCSYDPAVFLRFMNIPEMIPALGSGDIVGPRDHPVIQAASLESKI
jgi:hypothetical protein